MNSRNIFLSPRMGSDLLLVAAGEKVSKYFNDKIFLLIVVSGNVLFLLLAHPLGKWILGLF